MLRVSWVNVNALAPSSGECQPLAGLSPGRHRGIVGVKERRPRDLGLLAAAPGWARRELSPLTR